ncbi:MAG TPA: hypothetical protein PKY01_06640 [Candidatus Hydrogenedentes bacterium]|nr:hypothetical protein [Candidatus Hydrogenedentota bacterium]
MQESEKTARSVAALLLCPVLWCVGLNVAYGDKTEEKVRFTDTIAALGGKNLVPNASFEAGEAGWSSLGHGAGFQNAWAPLAPNWGNLSALHGTVEESSGTHGRAFLRIQLGGNHTPVFHFDYFHPVNHRELRPLAANLGWLEVNPGEPYTISLDMRASRNGVPAAFGVENEDPAQGLLGAPEEILEKVVLTQDWKRYSHTFVPKYPFLFVLAGPDLAQEEDVIVDVDAIQLEKGTQATSFVPRNELEVGIVPSASAGVFTTGEPASLQITACNSANAPARAKVSFRVTDFFDNPVELPAVTIEVPPSSLVKKTVPLPAQWQGFYRLVAVCRSGQTEEARLVRVAIVPPRTARETVIGVNHAYPTEFLIELAKKAGVSWYRDWSLKWQHVEPEPGKFQWEISDPQINRVAAHGVNVIAMIPFPSAEWNSTAPSLETLKAESERYRAGGRGDDQELIPRARWAWMPRDANELANFIKAGVGRYTEQVQVWEFLNEPLFTSYSLPDTASLRSTTLEGHTFDDYLNLLRTAASAIRAANPGARIVGGTGMFNNAKYTIPTVEAGILDTVDIFGVHDYPGKTEPEARFTLSEELLAAMKAHGGPKPIWMTEFSYFGTDDLPRTPFKPTPGSFSESRLLSEKDVADYIIRYCTMFLGRGGEKIFLHSGCTGSVNKPGTESCLFAGGGVRKVFAALAVFTELMGPSPQYIADKTGAGGLVFAFETGRQAVLVLWDPEENATVSVPDRATRLNIMGQEINRSRLRLTASPVYLIGETGSARQLFLECARAAQ